jgi:hypothetical protein
MTEQQAKKQARKLIGFYTNLFWFVVVNCILYFVDYNDNSTIDWAYWVTFGWGIGVIGNAFAVYLSPDLEERIIKNLMDKK